MEINQAAQWTVVDLCPGMPLGDIWPLSLRARALLSRNLAHPAIRDDFLRLHGVLGMLGALDYHFDNVLRLEVALTSYCLSLRNVGAGRVGRMSTPLEGSAIEHARYEVIAYIAALGRFHYFARATCVPMIVPISTIERLLVFRHKVVAHRSVDNPRGESAELLSLQALSLAPAGGQLYTPTTDGGLTLTYQIQRDVGSHENFVPRVDHASVMAEAYAVLEQVLR